MKNIHKGPLVKYKIMNNVHCIRCFCQRNRTFTFIIGVVTESTSTYRLSPQIQSLTFVFGTTVNMKRNISVPLSKTNLMWDCHSNL